MVEVVKKSNKILNIWKNLKSEWMKIVFPDNEKIIKDSITVLVASVILGLIIFGMDSVIGFIFGFLFNK